VLRPAFQDLGAYKRSQLNDGSYESLHPELFEPDRIVFLDGVLQSRRSGDAPYHEALVHPSMFAHQNPKRVAIIGGGEGATLREVLKHKTVEKVIMIEIDEKMVTLSREFLPFWSDCSMLAGSPASCFDDPRVEVYYEDAFKWFIDGYSGDGTDNKAEPFDVIIMDAL
jgi:spermidine synthase